MKRKFTFLLAALLLMSGLTWAQEQVTDVLNRAFTGVENTSYASWTNTGTSGTAYAGQSAGGNESIQLRSTNNNSGIVTTSSIGTAVSVSVTWNDATANGRTLNVYGSNTAYTNPTELYGDNAGELLGTIVKGGENSTTLEIDGQYAYIGLRSAGGAMYLTDITIVWEAGDAPTPTVATPTFNPAAGNYTETQTVEISCTTDGATIYYTLDGNDPTTESAEYTEALTIEETTTVKAFAVKEDYNNSAIATATYTITAPAQGQIFSRVANHAVEAGQTYLIVDVASGRALTSANGSSNAPAAVEVTIENDQINTDNTNLQWTFEATDGGYIIYPLNSTTTWLYSTNSNNGVRVGTNDNKVWALDITDNGSDYHGFKNTSLERYLGVYQATDWRTYTSIHNNIKDTQIELFVLGDQPYQPTPTITAANVDLAYDAEEGTISYTINNPVEGGVLTAVVTDGYEWISADEDEHTEATGTVGLIFDANTTTTARTATVTLTYTYENRETVTKTVTVTQAAAPVIYTTIPALFEAATSTVTPVSVTFGNWVVSAVSTNGKNVFVTDGTNGFVIFDNGGELGNTYTVGNILSGTVECSLKLQNGYAQLTNVNAENLTIATGGTVTVANIDMANLAGVYTGALVSYENLTCSVDNNKYYLSDGTTTVQIYNSLYTDAYSTLVAGKTYNITGIYQQYGSTKEILPRSAADIEKVVSDEPSITLASYEVEVNANAHTTPTTIAVTYANIDFENDVPEVVFYESDGSTEAIYDWLFVDLDADWNVYYTIEENTNNVARTAYFKVLGYDSNGNNVYSNLVTITQAAYDGPVAVLYTYSRNGVEDDYSDANTGETIALDGSANLDGFNFVGWTLNPNDVDNILNAGDDYTIQAEVTFYAVYQASEKEYTFAITPDDFNTTSYAANNGTHTSVATAEDGSIMNVTWYSNQVMKQSSEMQWQKNTGYIYNVTNLGSITDVTVDATQGEFTTVVGAIAQPTEAVENGSFFKTSVGNATGKSSALTVTFTGGPRYTRVFIDETVAGDITIVGPSIIPAGQTLDMGADYILENELGADRLVIEEGGQLYSVMEVEATMQKNINGYADVNTASGYYLIATPIMVEYNNAAETNLASNTYDLYAYEQSQELEWRNFKDAENDLSILFPSEGYLYANSETMTLEFKGELTVAMDDVISLAYSGDGVKALNLVGNPLPHNVTLRAYDEQHDLKTLNYLTMNEAGDGFITTSASEFEAVPMQGFFVQATEEGLHLTDQTEAGGGAGGGWGDDEEEFGVGPRPNSMMNITTHNQAGSLIDNAIVIFADGSMMNKYYLNETSTRLYIPQGGQELAVVRSNGQGEMPVNFKAAANGNYSISVNLKNVEMDYLHLIDNLTGTDVDLLVNPSYSFEAKTSDYATRFRIVFSADFVANDTDSNFAFFNGSQYVVSNQGEATLQVIDVMGRIVSSQTISGNAEVSVNEATGVYMLRLVNGNDVKTQKIVVR